MLNKDPNKSLKRTQNRPVNHNRHFVRILPVRIYQSILAQALAGRLGLVVISSDVTRKRLASVPEAEHRFEKFDAGIYSPEFSKKNYDAMLAEARSILSEGGSVIIDASFIKSGERLKAKRLAEETGARFFVLECNLKEGLTHRRLEQRLREGSVSDGRWEIFESQRERFDPILEVTVVGNAGQRHVTWSGQAGAVLLRVAARKAFARARRVVAGSHFEGEAQPAAQVVIAYLSRGEGAGVDGDLVQPPGEIRRRGDGAVGRA